MSGSTQPPTTAYGFYLRLWHAGFRWLYVVDARRVLPPKNGEDLP